MDRQIHCADGCFDMPSGKQVLDAPVMVGLLSAGAGDNPAAQRGKFKGLWEMTEGVTVRIELLFDFRPGHTGFKSRQVRSLIQSQQPVQAGQVHCQDRVPRQGWD